MQKGFMFGFWEINEFEIDWMGWIVWNGSITWKKFGYLYDKSFGFYERNEFVNWMDWIVWINWLIF